MEKHKSELLKTTIDIINFIQLSYYVTGIIIVVNTWSNIMDYPLVLRLLHIVLKIFFWLPWYIAEKLIG